MKFGRNLSRNQVPEWSLHYIHYKALKKQIKTAQEEGRGAQAEPDLAGFFHALDRNLEDVDHFYNKKYHDFSRRLKLLEDRYGSTRTSIQELEAEDREDLVAALLELRGQLRKLQWYGEVNRRGFIKITKKLDKKIPTAHAQLKYLALKVDPSAFATNAQLFKSLEQVNEWICTLGELASKSATDDNLSVSSSSLKRTTSNCSFRIPTERFSLLEQQIRQDEVEALDTTLSDIQTSFPDVSQHAYQQFLKTLLQKAVFARSRGSVLSLLRKIVFLDDHEDINGRNCLHRLVVSIGRAHANAEKQPTDVVLDAESELYSFITPATLPSKTLKQIVGQEDQRSKILSRTDEPVDFFSFVLDHLQSTQRSALSSKDGTGRTPLHFAAEYGVMAICEVIIEHLRAWNSFDVDEGIDGPAWQDNEGWAPLHLSVIGGHPLTTQALLNAERWKKGDSGPTQSRRTSPKSSAVLALATKANYVDIVRILVDAGVDINYQDEQGETALHVAARFGHAECARLLLTGTDVQRADTEIPEKNYAWTPLFIASVDGHLPVVELLIEADAVVERLDASGWTSMEHAALRGHIAIASRLAELTPAPKPEPVTHLAVSSSPPKTTSLTDRTSNALGTVSPQLSRTAETVKSFGHRYLTDKAMVLVSLGTMDMHKNVQAVNLDRIPLTNASSTQLDTALSMVVSAKSADGESEVIDLPIQENISTEPITFYAADPSQVKILFDLVPTYAGAYDRIVGRGVALLSSVKTSIGAKRMPLQGDVTVPIIAAGDLDVIGTVTFNFLIVNPFKHPNMSVSKEHTYWKQVASTMVIGHRGLGKNMASRNSLQLGENTIQSFVAAANLGANYVEFDVQLTKDHVPVIYHDFLVSETGIDAPVHTLTLEQFLHVGDTRTPRPSRPASPLPFERLPGGDANRKAVNGNGNGNGGSTSLAGRGRSMSVGGGINASAELEERMKHTRDFKKKGFKGNQRGNQIASSFATLEEMFRKLPSELGFNIEMKYPMLSESQSEEMDNYAVELNAFVDTVLTKVYDLAGRRNIIFSSFNPDVCLLLSFKQPSIPVLFLTDAGTHPVTDIRASSLQEAVRFAARWNLLGVVSAATPLVLAPRLVRVVKESGLVCVSYGSLNNDNEKVALQVNQGIDAVIVDSVLAIRKGLTGGAKKNAAIATGRNGNSNGHGNATDRPKPEDISERSTASNSQATDGAVLQTRSTEKHVNGTS